MATAGLQGDPSDLPEKPPPVASRLEVLLFTDIVDSTGIKSRLGTIAFAESLRKHNAIFEAVVSGPSGGRIIKHTGDGFFALFETASKAVRCALGFQGRLDAEHWDREPIRARVGIHLGEIAVVRMANRTDIVGSPADIAARIMALGSGGQTLVSRVAAEESRRFLASEPIRWHCHGLYRLKGVSDPVEIWEAAASDSRVLPAPAGAIDGRGPTAPYPQPTSSSDTIGPYRLLGQLGRGGMGTVYKAEQRRPVKRTVALKLIKPGFDSAEIIARFDSERQALARMDHRCIAKVLDAGTDDRGRPYFVMEYVPGVPIVRFADDNKLTIRERLALFVQVCDGVAHAHAKAIIHRDIKASNVLAYSSEGSAFVKIIDFGIAKALTSDRLTDMTFYTERGQAIGTIDSMSPEQADGRPDIDIRTDVYSLGVMLYELLSGVTPFDKDLLTSASDTEVRRIIRDVEPPRPSEKLSGLGDEGERIANNRGVRLSALRKQLAAELEWIPLMAMRKERDRRYATVKDLAADVANYLDGQPLRAGPESMIYRVGKRLRKQRARLLACGAVLLVLGACWVVLADSGFPVPGARVVQNWLDRHEASLFRPALSVKEIKDAAVQQRQALESHLDSNVLTDSGWALPSASVRDHTDAWTQMQTTAALFVIPPGERKHTERTVRVLSQLFEPNGICDPFIPQFGWPNFNDGKPSAEGLAWGLSAIALSLKNGEQLSAIDRTHLLEHLKQVEIALDNCRSSDSASGQPNGGWNMFAHQDKPSEANVYITGLVCLGLLEMKRADAPWHGDSKLRDALLHQTLAWIIQHFDGRGWKTPGRQAEEFNDGLTLEMFSLLLDAEADGLTVLPDALLAELPRQLADCEHRPLDHQIDVAFFSQPFHDHLGHLIARPDRSVRMLWHPWAIKCAALWLKRCQRLGAPVDELVRTRRVLSHLVVELGDAVVAEAKTGYTYVVSETLIGLAAVERL